MSDIVLLYPKTGFDIKGVSIDPPLALLAISSAVIDRFNVKIIDQRIDVNWRQTLKSEIEKKPICFGVTSMTGPQISYALEASAIVKSADPDIPVIWGGVHATLLPEQTLQNRNLDIVVIGEGEATFKELVEGLAGKKDLRTIKGIAYKDGASIIRTDPREFLDFGIIPEIPFDLVDIEQYIGSQGRFKGAKTRSLIFISSRGCPWGCTYCCNPRLSKRKWRSLPAEETFTRVSKLVRKYKLDAVAFHDEEFLVDPVRVEKIAKWIKNDFKWWIQSRMDRLMKSDLKFLNQSGLWSVQPGIESGSDRILNMIHKGETTTDIITANNKLSKTDIIPLYNFMMGFPTESYEELMQTVDLSLRLLKDNPNAQISGFYTCIPYPGTDLFELAKSEGFQIPASLEEWSRFNRQHLETPWLKDRLDTVKSLMITSKFVDGARLKNRLDDAFGGIKTPKVIYALLARFYRKRWKRRIFSTHLDQWLNAIVLSIFNLSQKRVSRKKKEQHTEKRQIPFDTLRFKRYDRCKLYFDFIVSLILLICLLPLFLFVSLLIKLSSKGPIFFIDKAVGKNGRVFAVFKFRTMHHDCDRTIHKNFLKSYIRENKEFSMDKDGKKIFKLVNDRRVTKIGKFLRKTSIDELPQLINVVKGEMSLVGPRAPLVSEYKMYSKWHKMRVVVTPGITGYHQVTGRGRDTFKKMLQKDLFYIKNRSFLLDLFILTKTIFVVISGKDAH